jgi:hypothetical protein
MPSVATVRRCSSHDSFLLLTYCCAVHTILLFYRGKRLQCFGHCEDYIFVMRNSFPAVALEAAAGTKGLCLQPGSERCHCCAQCKPPSRCEPPTVLGHDFLCHDNRILQLCIVRRQVKWRMISPIPRPCLSLLPLFVLPQPPLMSLGSGMMLAAPCVISCNRFCYCYCYFKSGLKLT